MAGEYEQLSRPVAPALVNHGELPHGAPYKARTNLFHSPFCFSCGKKYDAFFKSFFWEKEEKLSL